VGNPITALEMGEVQTAARTLGLHLVTLEIRRPEDIVPAFETLKSDAQALYVAGDPLVLANRVRINTLALVARLPAFYNERAYVEAGGLMSYGVNWPDLFRRTAELVDKILRGAKPGQHPGRAADQIRPRHQPHHCEGARPRSAPDPARPRRRGDRVTGRASAMRTYL